MRRLTFVLSIFVVCLLFIPAVSAQSMFATLSGTVTDSSGAVVPEASVTVKEVSSGETRKSVTNQQGFFTFSTLPAGTYELIVETKGFATYDVAGIVLTASDIRTTNISLKVATAAEKVVVKTLVEDISVVDSGEKSATVDAKTVQELSLVSRDASELVTILPGAILSTNYGENHLAVSGETVGMDTAGTIGNSNVNGQWVDITMDGGHTLDAGKPGLKSPVTPNPDMISEVKVLTSNFSADNPKGPVVMNTVSKSGTKDFHGDGRFYARNGVLNSNDAFNKNQVVPIASPNSSYYYPGFGLGGPVIIPITGINKSRQKLFFYDGFEYYRQQVDFGVNRAFVMTPDMLNGDFSALNTFGSLIEQNGIGVVPTLPANVATAGCGGGGCLAWQPAASVSASRLAGCTITGGVMSQACVDPEAQALLKAYLPAPTLQSPDPNTGFNYIADALSPMNAWQNLARVDWNISDNTKVFVTYNHQGQTATWPYGPWTMAGKDNGLPAPVAVIGGDQSDFLATTFMHVFSPTMTSETKFYYTYTSFPERPQDPKKLLRGQYGGIPGFDLHGIYGPTTAPMIPSWTQSFPDMGAIGDSFQNGKMVYYSKLPSVEQNLTKVVGTHTMKFGAYFEQVYHAQVNWSQYMGVYQYGPWTTIAGNNYADALMGVSQSNYYEALQPPGPLAVNDTLFDFYAQDDWKVSRRLTVNYGLRVDHYGKPYNPDFGMATFIPGLYNNDPSQLNNNTGVVWHADAPWVPSSGSPSRFLFYSPRLGASFDVFGNGRTVVRGGWGKYRNFFMIQDNAFVQPATTSVGSSAWTCGWNDPLCPSWEDVDLHAIKPQFGKGLGPGLKSIAVVDPFNDEAQLVTSFSLSIDQKLPGKMTAEISYVGNRGNFNYWYPDINAVPVGQLFNPVGGCNPQTGGNACIDANRPRQNYETINDTMNFDGNKSQFDSLQASLQRNVGFTTLMLNYTWSKNFATNGEGDGYADYGAKEYYGVTPINRTQAFSAAYVFRIPGMHGGNSFVRSAVNGWEISGITQVESGANITSGSSNGWGWFFNYSQDNGTASDGSTIWNNNIAKMGTNAVQLMPLITCNPKSNLKPGQYLNGACFAPAPGNGVNGTTGLPMLAGPMFWNSDITLMKSFKITERQNLQFRIAAFNFLNHSLPSFVTNDNNIQLQWDASGKLKNSNFGYTDAHYGHRIMELGLKYSF